MSGLKIGIIMGTTRAGRICDTATDWLPERAAEYGLTDYEAVDMRDNPLPFFNEPLAPMWTPAKNAAAQAWNSHVAAFDGHIFVTVEYNHGVPAVLKNALDHSYAEFVRKPPAFIAYGGVDAARAIEQLRLILAELQMAPLRSAVHVGLSEFLGVLQQGMSLSYFPYLADAATALFDDLIWWAAALKRARAQG